MNLTLHHYHEQLSRSKSQTPRMEPLTTGVWKSCGKCKTFFVISKPAFVISYHGERAIISYIFDWIKKLAENNLAAFLFFFLTLYYLPYTYLHISFRSCLYWLIEVVYSKTKNLQKNSLCQSNTLLKGTFWLTYMMFTQLTQIDTKFWIYCTFYCENVRFLSHTTND